MTEASDQSGGAFLRPGPRNSLTDLPGIWVGNAEDANVRSGVTVIAPQQPMAMGVHVMGGGPGTRDTDALDPSCLVQQFHALVLSGGSEFGLAAADGVTAALSERGVGLPVPGPRVVPVVPSAILFDLGNGGDKGWGTNPPYRDLGIAALEAVGEDFALGNAGAGLGATAGRLKGGLGSASIVREDGLVVAALVAANPFGEVVMPGGRTFWAWALEQERELGGLTPPSAAPAALDFRLGPPPISGSPGTNTTLAVVGTNLALDKAGLTRMAMMAHDGLARAIRPIHTPFDGDTVFSISTGEMPCAHPEPAALAEVGTLAADCLARAVMRGVAAADTLGDHPGWGSL